MAQLRRPFRRYPDVVETFADSPQVTVRRLELPDLRPARMPSSTVSAPDRLPIFDLELPAKFAGWEPLVAAVPHGRIVGQGYGVFDAEDRLVKQSLWDEDHFRRDFAIRPPRRTAVRGGTVASILTLWADNYYHWLIDGLPRLGVLAAAGYDFRALPLVVPAPLRRFQAESLAALGIAEHQLIGYRGASPSVETLLVPSAAAVIGFCSPFIPQWLRQQLAPSDPSPSRRLYIARQVRRLANEDELWPLLARQGFELVRPENLSFAEQVRLFAAAEVIVGPHGAGMANVAFARDARVLEFFQPGYLNAGPYSVSRAAGHAYWAMVGQPVGSPKLAKNLDIQVDRSQFEATLAEVLTGL